MPDRDPIIVIDRETGEPFEEAVLGEKWIRWAYQDSKSGLVERVLFRSSVFSRLMGWWFDSRFSRGKIAPTIEELSIDPAEFALPVGDFRSFNDFFARNLKPEARPFDASPEAIVSPADGRALVFPEIDDDIFAPVKGKAFSLRKMLPGQAERFLGGALAIVRLCPADYHRYHFPCAGEIVESGDIRGALHSVNPIALAAARDVFGENKRSWTLLETDRVGTMCFLEIGAFGVGSIINTKTTGRVEKMDEKGYFKFGGSTVIVIFEKDRIRFADDLVKNSAAGKETLVKVGAPLAVSIN